MAHMHLCVIFISGIFLCGPTRGDPSLQMSEHDLRMEVGGKWELNIHIWSGAETECANISITYNEDIIATDKQVIPVVHSVSNYSVTVLARYPGHATVNFSLVDAVGDRVLDTKFVRVTVEHDEVIYYVSAVIGWIYFVAWSVSFYPQIYENWRRKSVVGLNFDFLSLNIVGFMLYSLFNCGLFWITEVEEEYMRRYPTGLNPVQVNDIVFSLHASVATLITIIQCFIYERGSQRVSWTARGLLAVFAAVVLISLILAWTDVIEWLDFLSYCSYVKLAITLIKYVPQAYMNYRRKSTEGWSIGNIFLDFTGGLLSMLQMILNAYNYNDWESIFGDPTKFGLGLFSVVFDIFFIIQHYFLYRHSKEIDLIH
ncbi:Cystinosin-like protein [Cryptotermes secundus]|uniref:Cystinosin-like protein n=1 Tax=Cryptotermes secundus TaxID=105785 RepID=A0A2J7R8J3_9NEOP|nr:cystinosin homolog isoform X2 [Cryptotermes secundus]PNF37153.1 Cystinosin-like protein [Cryptotermes secundus]